MPEMKTMLAATMFAATMLSACNHGAAPSTAQKVEDGVFEKWQQSPEWELAFIGKEGTQHAHCTEILSLVSTENRPENHHPYYRGNDARSGRLYKSAAIFNDNEFVYIHRGMFAGKPRQPGDLYCRVHRDTNVGSYFQTRDDVFTITAHHHDYDRTTASADAPARLMRSVLTTAAVIAVQRGYKYGEITSSGQTASGEQGRTEVRTTGSGRSTAHTLYGVTFGSANSNVVTRETTTGRFTESSRMDTIKFYREPPEHDNYFDTEIIARNIYGEVPKVMKWEDVDIGRLENNDEHIRSLISRGRTFMPDHEQFVLSRRDARRE